jgi:hypothetical protein
LFFLVYNVAMSIDYFDSLVNQGLKVIPLHANSKIPIGKNWRSWDKSRARKRCLQHPDANLGIVLGDIIDVEGDNESANNFLNDLIADYPHPVYASSRSLHHLFLTPDPKLKIFKFQKIEFRGHGHQSVLPPSEFYGITYRWLSTAQFPVPVMPARLLRFYNKINGLKDDIKPGHTIAYCAFCGKKCFLHHKRWLLELNVFQKLGMPWTCRSCRTMDIRPVCRRLSR